MAAKKYQQYYALAGKASFENWHSVMNSRLCGCFYCGAIYPPTEITCDDWVQDAHGKTVLCPRCGIDSVMGDASGIPIREDVLQEIYQDRFGD